MAPPLAIPDTIVKLSSKFDIFTTVYKTIGKNSITVDILIPKDIQPGKYPLLIRFHGGGLITGSSSYLGFCVGWVMQYALNHSAIIVQPNYRLLPEARGLDIMEDLSDFWQWVHADLQLFFSECKTKENLEVDESRILVYGDSAGGYLAIQSGLTQPTKSIKAIIATYPMIDLQSPWFTKSYPKALYSLPMLPSTVVDEHMTNMQPNAIVSADDPPDRLDLMIAAFQHGRLGDMLGDDASLYPLESIEGVKGYPPFFIFHGKDDSIVPTEGTEKFVKKLEQSLPGGKVLAKFPIGDHGFDSIIDLETPWLSEGLQFITAEWLG